MSFSSAQLSSTIYNRGRLWSQDMWLIVNECAWLISGTSQILHWNSQSDQHCLCHSKWLFSYLFSIFRIKQVFHTELVFALHASDPPPPPPPTPHPPKKLKDSSMLKLEKRFRCILIFTSYLYICFLFTAHNHSITYKPKLFISDFEESLDITKNDLDKLLDLIKYFLCLGCDVGAKCDD